MTLYSRLLKYIFYIQIIHSGYSHYSKEDERRFSKQTAIALKHLYGKNLIFYVIWEKRTVDDIAKIYIKNIMGLTPAIIKVIN